MTVTVADIVAFLAIFALPAAAGIYMGRECYRDRMGRLLPALFVGLAVASGIGQLIGATLKYLLEAMT